MLCTTRTAKWPFSRNEETDERQEEMKEQGISVRKIGGGRRPLGGNDRKVLGLRNFWILAKKPRNASPCKNIAASWQFSNHGFRSDLSPVRLPGKHLPQHYGRRNL